MTDDPAAPEREAVPKEDPAGLTLRTRPRRRNPNPNHSPYACFEPRSSFKTLC